MPYLFLMISQMLSSFYVTAVYASTSSLYVGVCYVIKGFNNDIRQHLRRINRTFIDQKSVNKWKQIDAMRRLLEIIKFHSRTRE